ncbi:hypothetical protein J4210_06010 [Candidatus Woesearchaeota archaeon]|nr:hypothetical protein [Candidatus Woesearchaeota archaeon]
MPYSVTRCPHCHAFQMFQHKTIQTAVFRCVTCSKQTKVHKKDGSLLRLFGTFEHPALASGRCQELKARPVEEFKFASLSQE